MYRRCLSSSNRSKVSENRSLEATSVQQKVIAATHRYSQSRNHSKKSTSASQNQKRNLKPTVLKIKYTWPLKHKLGVFGTRALNHRENV